MAKRHAEGGQPSMEKLMAEGVSPRKCISYEGLGEYQGGGSGTGKSSGNTSSKPMGSLASIPRRGGSGY